MYTQEQFDAAMAIMVSQRDVATNQAINCALELRRCTAELREIREENVALHAQLREKTAPA